MRGVGSIALIGDEPEQEQGTGGDLISVARGESLFLARFTKLGINQQVPILPPTIPAT